MIPEELKAIEERAASIARHSPELEKLANELACMMECKYVNAMMDDFDKIKAILDEFDYADPSSRFNKDLVMGRINRIKAILQG